MPRQPHRVVFVLLGLLFLLQTTLAHAASKESHPVAYERLWSCVVRLLKIDQQFEINDQDKNAGYIVFTYKSRTGQTSRGTVELFPEEPVPRSEAKRFVVQISLSGASSIEERLLLSALQRKLREEKLI